MKTLHITILKHNKPQGMKLLIHEANFSNIFLKIDNHTFIFICLNSIYHPLTTPCNEIWKI
jgi:hypothetical protein